MRVLLLLALAAPCMGEAFIGGNIMLGVPPASGGLELHFQEYGKLGWYFGFDSNFKSKDGSSGFYDNISVNKAENIFHDELIGTQDGTNTFSLGFYFPVARALSPYVGFVVGKEQQFRNYLDHSEILGGNGSYWIKGDAEKSAGIQLGIALREKDSSQGGFTGNIGYQTLYKQVRIGIGYCISG